jgi:tetratricopeptide (TPR) repeat protein
MEAVFERVTDAHTTLSSPEARQEYYAWLAARPPSERPAAQVPVAPAVVDRATAARRAEALEALKRRYEEAKGKAKVHAATAARARAASDFVGAAAAYEQALLITPQDPALRAAYAEVQAAGAERLASSHLQQAVLEERYGHWAEAAASWERLLAVRPDDAEAKARLAIARSRIVRR